MGKCVPEYALIMISVFFAGFSHILPGTSNSGTQVQPLPLNCHQLAKFQWVYVTGGKIRVWVMSMLIILSYVKNNQVRDLFFSAFWINWEVLSFARFQITTGIKMIFIGWIVCLFSFLLHQRISADSLFFFLLWCFLRCVDHACTTWIHVAHWNCLSRVGKSLLRSIV